MIVIKMWIHGCRYHSLHHSQVHTNFCLFMPMYDYWGGTQDPSSDALYRACRRGGRKGDATDVVYLSHATDLLHMLHVTLGVQSFAARPYARPHWLLWPVLYPLAGVILALLWLCGQPFAADKYRLPAVTGQTWLIPRYRFQVRFQNARSSLTLNPPLLRPLQRRVAIPCIRFLYFCLK